MRGIAWIYAYLVSCAQLFCVFLVALFLPKLFVLYASTQGVVEQPSERFKLGLENVSPAVLADIKGTGFKKNVVGLVTNHTGTDQSGLRNIDILLNHGVKIAYLFTPKHGYYADKQTVHTARHTKDAKTHIPVISWHSAQLENKLAEYLDRVDILLFDMQDSGMRHGYVATLLDVLKTCQRYGKKIVVLDRPNLLGHNMEGSADVQQAPIPSIPIRHGMTVGELALYFNANTLESPADLQVVPMEHYHRSAVKPKAPLMCKLSPNIPSLEACYGYSFLGLLGEVAPFDVGLGTDKTFQCVGLPEALNIPKHTWYQARELLKEHGIEAHLHRYYSKRKKGHFNGLLVTVRDVNEFASFSAFLDVLRFFKKEGIKLTFSPQFDAIVGGSKVRGFLDGTIKRAELAGDVNNNLRNFFQKAAPSFIYTPLPKIVPV